MSSYILFFLYLHLAQPIRLLNLIVRFAKEFSACLSAIYIPGQRKENDTSYYQQTACEGKFPAKALYEIVSDNGMDVSTKRFEYKWCIIFEAGLQDLYHRQSSGCSKYDPANKKKVLCAKGYFLDHTSPLVFLIFCLSYSCNKQSNLLVNY